MENNKAYPAWLGDEGYNNWVENAQTPYIPDYDS